MSVRQIIKKLPCNYFSYNSPVGWTVGVIVEENGVRYGDWDVYENFPNHDDVDAVARRVIERKERAADLATMLEKP